MNLYYAMGGGLGHLTRARAVLRTLKLEGRASILSSSPFARDPRVAGPVPVLSVPAELAENREDYRSWLAELLERHHPEVLILDTFPAGIVGEFCELPLPLGTALHHVARLLRWGAYVEHVGAALPRLGTTYMVERLPEAQKAALSERTEHFRDLELVDPPWQPAESDQRKIREVFDDGRPFWLIVHSGGVSEVLELVAYAEQIHRLEQSSARLVLIAPEAPPGLSDEVEHVDLYPASILFPRAAGIFTACGFNAMRQTAVYRSKHRFLPFQRRFDDQFCRARYRRQTTE